jgi:hypothetical protein
MVFLKLHSHGVFAVEIFWGLWLFPFGFLVFKSRFLPRILGILLIIAGFAYVTHSFISLLLSGRQHTCSRSRENWKKSRGWPPIGFRDTCEPGNDFPGFAHESGRES